MEISSFVSNSSVLVLAFRTLLFVLRSGEHTLLPLLLLLPSRDSSAFSSSCIMLKDQEFTWVRMCVRRFPLSEKALSHLSHL